MLSPGSEPVGVVLAGGASRRFGRDKARFEIEGETLAARAARKLGEVCDEVVVADRGRGVVPAARSIEDGAGRGPAAGVLGAADRFPERALLVLACDLPNVPLALLGALLEPREDWIAPRVECRIETTCALYTPRAVTALRRRVAKGDLALRSLAMAPLRVRFLEQEELERFGDVEGMFLNVNREADLG